MIKNAMNFCMTIDVLERMSTLRMFFFFALIESLMTYCSKDNVVERALCESAQRRYYVCSMNTAASATLLSQQSWPTTIMSRTAVV
jgi:hypothetical protein